VPLILARQEPEAETVILQHAEALKCPVHRVPDQPRWTTALKGRHQVQNANTAAVAAELLAIEPLAVAEGLRTVRWPGRLEYVSYHPDLVLDGAHNPAGAAALAAYIRENCAGKPVWLVYGAMRDKAVDEVVATLFPLADRLILTAPNFPRALRPQAILAAHPHPDPVIASTVPEACEVARQAPPQATVFLTGSLYLVGEARRHLLSA
jgi:dihydrofolate synthase/folylpolyglutamate synthase